MSINTKLLASWKRKENTLLITNQIFLEQVIEWTYSFNAETGKEKLKTSLPIDELVAREKRELNKQVISSKLVSLDYFLHEIKESMQESTDPFFRSKNISLEGEKAYKFSDNVIAIPLYHSFKKDVIKGFCFINKNTGNTYNFSLSPTGMYLDNGNNSKRIYYTNDFLSAFLIINYTGDRVVYSENIKDLIVRLKDNASKSPHSEFLFLSKNPSQKELLDLGVSPAKYEKEISQKFDIYNNVITRYPSDSKGYKTFYDFGMKEPKAFEEFLNYKYDNQNFVVLGSLGNKVYVWSDNLKDPHPLTQSSKIPELELVAPISFFKEKFGEVTDKKILSKIFNVARGKIYDPSIVKYAGLYNEDSTIVINTGDKVVGETKGKYFYVPSGNFPEPLKKPEIDSETFFKLYNNILSKIPIGEIENSYSIVAFTALSIFSRVLPARFSLHLYGDSSSGKSFTVNNVIKPMLKSFSNSISSLIPGNTFAGFKDDLRIGKSLFLFDESENDSYDPNIMKIIRSSTYAGQEIKQMVGNSMSSVKTPVDFMSVSMFNFEPKGLGASDLNRVLGINYSLRSRNFDVKSVLTSLGTIDLDKFGLNIYSFLYKNWNEFIGLFAKYNIELSLIENKVNGHKKAVYAQLLAFYELTSLLSEEGLDNYKKFIMKQSEESYSSNDQNMDLINDIGRIPVPDKFSFKKKNIRVLIDDLPWKYGGGGNAQLQLEDFQEWSKWAKHVFGTYKIKITRTRAGSVIIIFPLRSKFIIKELERFGYADFTAQSYSKIIESQYQITGSTTDIGTSKYKYVGIPIEHFTGEKGSLADKWTDFVEHNPRLLFYR